MDYGRYNYPMGGGDALGGGSRRQNDYEAVAAPLGYQVFYTTRLLATNHC